MESFNHGLKFGTDIITGLFNVASGIIGFSLPFIAIAIVAVSIGLLFVLVFGGKE